MKSAVFSFKQVVPHSIVIALFLLFIRLYKVRVVIVKVFGHFVE